MTIKCDFSVLEYLSCPVFVLELTADGDPCYVACNAQAVQLFGRPKSAFLGRTAQEVFGGDLGRIIHLRHLAALRTGRPLTYLRDLPEADQNSVICSTIHPQLDAHGNAVRLYDTLSEVVPDAAGQEGRISYDTLASELESFVEMAAHDLRAPMRNISLLADLLRDTVSVQHTPDTPQSEGLSLIDLMDDVATKSMDMVSDVLAHATTLGPLTASSTFEFEPLCQTILTALDPAARIEVDISPAEITTDNTALQIALRNLIGHALRHHDADDPLDLDIAVQPGMPGLLDITLTHTGATYAADALKTLNDGTLCSDTGYGLFRVNRLITARGGSVFARNAPDMDQATVRFCLPGEVNFQPSLQPGLLSDAATLSAHLPGAKSTSRPFNA